MTLHHGARARRRTFGLGAMAAVIGPLLLLAVFAGSWLLQRGPAVREARDWTITGPPCPQASPAAFAAQGRGALQAFEFGGVVFARRFGHASCALIGYGGGRGFGRYRCASSPAPTGW